MERECSVNPPSHFIEHIGENEYSREIEIRNNFKIDHNAW